MPIQFFFLDTKVTLTNRTALKGFVARMFKKEGYGLKSLTYVFCSDEYLLKINQQYLSHNYYTDIITFDLSDIPGLITGEIYISIDRIKENAGKEGVTINEELHRVIFHGALHLCGYKDKTAKDKIAMTSAEDKFLGLYFK